MPYASGNNPAPTPAADPEEEPPGEWPELAGFMVGPDAEKANVSAKKLLERVKSAGRLDSLKEDIAHATAIDRIVESATPVDVPARADAASGFAPLGAVAELGAPAFRWTLNERDAIWADDVAELAEQASAGQWDASRDIPWEAARGLPDFMERAVSQVMTFIAQNEFAALYVPAAFIANINPRYHEMLMWLAGHVHDSKPHLKMAPEN